MKNLIFFGAPGAGKGTQAKKVAEQLKLIHLSTGDILRAAVDKKTEHGGIAKKFMDNGELVPDDIMIRLVEAKIKKLNDANGFIFDGFPRTIAQAEAFDEMLSKLDMTISHVIHLKVAKEILVKRLLKRSVLEARNDDRSIETIEKRITTYITKTTPIKEYYLKQNKLHKIAGTGDIEDIFNRILEVISN